MTAIDRLPATDPRAALKLLSAALIKVHKAMLDTELERFGAAADPYQRLSLVTGHPDFAWLKAISDLIVAIDETRSTCPALEAFCGKPQGVEAIEALTRISARVAAGNEGAVR